MKKTPSIFLRDFNGNPGRVTTTPNPACPWVFEGLGVATKKIDGTACRIRYDDVGNFIYERRYEIKQGKTAPIGFIPASDVDPETGKQPGWIPVGDGPDGKWHREALIQVIDDTWAQEVSARCAQSLLPGTYELVGHRIQGNPYRLMVHRLVSHEDQELVIHDEPQRTYAAIETYLKEHPEIEGIVYHYGDQFAKIKRRDFGLPWPEKTKDLSDTPRR
jgi:hypothetical protein